MTGVFGAAIIALGTGFGVYRSCTRYPEIMRTALFIDVVATVATIGIFYAIGIFQ